LIALRIAMRAETLGTHAQQLAALCTSGHNLLWSWPQDAPAKRRRAASLRWLVPGRGDNSKPVDIGMSADRVHSELCYSLILLVLLVWLLLMVYGS